MWEISHCLSKHDSRSPLIVHRLWLHDEGIKQLRKNIIKSDSKFTKNIK